MHGLPRRRRVSWGSATSWDIISRDYNRKLSPRTCLRNVTKYLAPGAIVVFHDSEKAFRNMRYALPRTLEKIRQMGLKCKAIEF